MRSRSAIGITGPKLWTERTTSSPFFSARTVIVLSNSQYLLALSRYCAITIERDGDKRGNGAVGERSGIPANHQAAYWDRSEANDAAADSRGAIVVGTTEMVDVLHHLRRFNAPLAGGVHLLQIGIENRY